MIFKKFWGSWLAQFHGLSCIAMAFFCWGAFTWRFAFSITSEVQTIKSYQVQSHPDPDIFSTMIVISLGECFHLFNSQCPIG
jgi:hypothetical protein